MEEYKKELTTSMQLLRDLLKEPVCAFVRMRDRMRACARD